LASAMRTVAMLQGSAPGGSADGWRHGTIRQQSLLKQESKQLWRSVGGTHPWLGMLMTPPRAADSAGSPSWRMVSRTRDSGFFVGCMDFLSRYRAIKRHRPSVICRPTWPFGRVTSAQRRTAKPPVGRACTGSRHVAHLAASLACGDRDRALRRALTAWPARCSCGIHRNVANGAHDVNVFLAPAK
jgi:hypothetical protein